MSTSLSQSAEELEERQRLLRHKVASLRENVEKALRDFQMSLLVMNDSNVSNLDIQGPHDRIYDVLIRMGFTYNEILYESLQYLVEKAAERPNANHDKDMALWIYIRRHMQSICPGKCPVMRASCNCWITNSCTPNCERLKMRCKCWLAFISTDILPRKSRHSIYSIRQLCANATLQLYNPVATDQDLNEALAPLVDLDGKQLKDAFDNAAISQLWGNP